MANAQKFVLKRRTQRAGRNLENSYLKIAADVLCVVRKPMSAKEIVGLAIERGMMPKHLYGKTPHKTMQARLSEDIVARQRASAFFRTGAGEFFLRSLQSDKSVPSEHKQEYIAPRRKLQLPREYILTTKSQLWEREFSKTIPNSNTHSWPISNVRRRVAWCSKHWLWKLRSRTGQWFPL